MSVKIIDNFLENNDFMNLQNVLLGSDFPWYFNGGVVYSTKEPGKWNFQFTHSFYRNDEITSGHFYLMQSFIKKINPLALVRIKANMLTASDKNIQHGMHVDIKDDKITTAVFYVNTNNGYTIFDNGEKIESIENRIVIFPSYLLHSGSTCTDEKARVVINFNYIEKSEK